MLDGEEKQRFNILWYKLC